MRSSTIVVALAGAVSAYTPPNFQPSNTGNLTVAFGTVSALNGVNLPREGTFSSLPPINIPMNSSIN
jgi:hypothetical protein